MTISEVIVELRGLNQPVPEPLRLPTEEEVEAAEERLGIKFTAEYRQYLLEASDVVYGTLEPAVVVPDSGKVTACVKAKGLHTEAIGVSAYMTPNTVSGCFQSLGYPGGRVDQCSAGEHCRD